MPLDNSKAIFHYTPLLKRLSLIFTEDLLLAYYLLCVLFSGKSKIIPGESPLVKTYIIRKKQSPRTAPSTAYGVLICLIVLFGTGSAWSQPSITGISGVLEEDNQVYISGVNFGNNGPKVVLFDDFEDGVLGSPIKTGEGSASFGQWHIEVGNTTYSNAESVSGNKAFRADMSDHWLKYTQVLLPDTPLDVFVSYWLLIPEGDKIPGEDSSEGINWKTTWLQGEGTVDDDQVIPALLSSSWTLFGNNTPYTGWPSAPYLVKGKWKHFKVWIKGGYNNDGEVKLWHLDHNGPLSQTLNQTSVSTMYAGGARERIRFNGYGRSTNNCHPMFDDVYVATGPNGQARIEVGDNINYLECSNIAVSVPTSWSDNNINAVLHTGSFPPGDAFLFVVNSQGEVSQGFSFEIGGVIELGAPGMPGQPHRDN